LFFVSDTVVVLSRPPHPRPATIDPVYFKFGS
jgi:hypothetical protein